MGGEITENGLEKMWNKTENPTRNLQEAKHDECIIQDNYRHPFNNYINDIP
jgi:hypothetical protein